MGVATPDRGQFPRPAGDSCTGWVLQPLTGASFPGRPGIPVAADDEAGSRPDPASCGRSVAQVRDRRTARVLAQAPMASGCVLPWTVSAPPVTAILRGLAFS